MAATANETGTSTEGRESPAAEGSRTFTQEEVNRLLAKERRDAQAKYQDYDKYKQAYDEAEKRRDAEKSELQKAREAQAAAEAELGALKAQRQQAEWIAAASKATGVPAEALHGDTEEAVNSCAESLKQYFAKPTAPVVETGSPSSDAGGTGDPLRDAINNAL